MLSRYNRIANERPFETCARLDVAEYQKQRQGSFGGIHGLLNHILLGDQIWMARFEGSGHSTPRLNTVLAEDFADLRRARMEEDARIEAFFSALIAESDSSPATVPRFAPHHKSVGREQEWNCEPTSGLL